MAALRALDLRIFGIFLLPSLLFVGVVFVYPVLKILLISVTDPQPGLGNYMLLVENPALRRVFITTIRIAVLTTLISTLIGYLLAYRMHVAKAGELRIIIFCLMFPLWTSVLVRAFAWVALLQNNGIVNAALLGLGAIDQPLPMSRNELGVLIGMVHVMVPYATLPIYSAMKGIDPRLMQAARSLGAGAWPTFWRIFMPLTLPGVGAGMILVFITSIGFYVTPIVLGGGKVVMVAEYISVQITETLRWGLGSMLATVLLAVVLLFVFAFRRLTVLRQGAA
ncbi:ABC transporter permease [Vineibacter terrae]|uniref:ABC transporter permease n=1 Tax=Vineibacter terrae TaxID=2586908 RepID=UPI002E3595CC|nr:ABC transporter permease [Vineibacter terrae]HEX2885902.1 ABC transporter permease [Vineibacter terrae]